MARNKPIEVFKGKTKIITATIRNGLDALDGYTAEFKVFTEAGVEQFTETGSIAGLVITFVLSKAHNDLDEGEYEYEGIIYNGTYLFSLGGVGDFTVKHSPATE